MAGLYRRGVQRNAGTPMMQVQGSQGAGGAVPRGGGLPAASQDDAKTSENIQRLGGLLGMMKQQKQALEDVAPSRTAAEQATSNVNSLADTTRPMGFGSAPSADGNWGGVQVSSFGSGVPTSTGEFSMQMGNDWNNVPGAAPMATPAVPFGSGVDATSAAANGLQLTPQFGKDIAGAANTAAAVQPQGFLDILQNGWGALKGAFNFGGGAGA